MSEDKGSSAPWIALFFALPLVAVGPIVAIGAMGTVSDMETAGQVCSSGNTSGTGQTPSIPNGWGELVAAAAETASLPVSIAAAQLQQESGWDPKARSSAGAQGLAQFMPGTWAMYGNGGDPFDPEDAIQAYGRYMAALRAEVLVLAGDDVDLQIRLTLAAYNAGPGAVLSNGGIPPFAETQRYIDAILSKGQTEFSPDCEVPPGGEWNGDLGDGDWTNPLPGGVLTSGYGHRDVPGLPAWAQEHVGVDFSTPGVGGQVIAPTDLRVTGFNNPDGCVIAKEDGDDPDFGFAFCHMNSYSVGLGDKLQRGDVIGIEGNRAQLGAIATHLHFEIYKPEAPDVVYPYEGWNLDPEPILKEKGAWPE